MSAPPPEGPSPTAGLSDPTASATLFAMRAWTVDADDIRVAEDFDESLLHRTPEIDDFLSPDRDDKFIVIGTKGFGKTLLLKAKRILYQQRQTGVVCLPDEQPARQADRRQDLQQRGDGASSRPRRCRGRRSG